MAEMIYTSDLLSGATCIGLAHKNMRKPNQDYVLVKKSKWLSLICVADGVGSHEYSHKGSKQICKSVYKAFKALKRGNISAEELIEHVNLFFVNKLKNKYGNRTATTCIFAAIMGNTLYVGQAGDGICGIIFDGKLKTLGYRNTDFVNEVYPIKPDSDNSGKWNFRIIDTEKYHSLDIFLGTDGVSDDILPEKFGDFIKYIFSEVEPLRRRKRDGYIKNMLLNWSTPNSNDDKTVAILRWKRNEDN